MNMRAWRTAVVSSGTRRAIPIMTHPGIDIIGSTVQEAVTHGDVHYRAVRALAERYPSAAATMMMDLSVEADAFGAPVRFAPDEVPTVSGRLVEGEESISRLKVPPVTAGRIPEYLKAARLAAEAIHDRPVFAGCIGPFSLAGRLYDMTEIMTGLLIEPDAIHALLDRCAAFLVSYAAAFKAAGANGLVIAEPAAGVLSPDDCTAFSSTYVKRIVDAVQDDSFMVVLHNCGAREVLVPAMLATGAAGFHYGNVIDMLAPLKVIPGDRLVMGNIDPVRTLKMATAGEVRQSVLTLLERTMAFPNYVLSTGCDSPPGVPQANVEAFYEGLALWNSRSAAGQ